MQVGSTSGVLQFANGAVTAAFAAAAGEAAGAKSRSAGPYGGNDPEGNIGVMDESGNWRPLTNEEKGVVADLTLDFNVGVHVFIPGAGAIGPNFGSSYIPGKTFNHATSSVDYELEIGTFADAGASAGIGGLSNISDGAKTSVSLRCPSLGSTADYKLTM